MLPHLPQDMDNTLSMNLSCLLLSYRKKRSKRNTSTFVEKVGVCKSVIVYNQKETFTWSLSFSECCLQILNQMNPSPTSVHSKATGLTKIFSPATLLILDMSPSIVCTIDQCQTNFACSDFCNHEQHNTCYRT